MWIARLCVTYSAELIMKCLNVLRAKLSFLYVIKFYLVSEGVFEKEGFHDCNK